MAPTLRLITCESGYTTVGSADSQEKQGKKEEARAEPAPQGRNWRLLGLTAKSGVQEAQESNEAKGRKERKSNRAGRGYVKAVKHGDC